jgi:hypothetical protein
VRAPGLSLVRPSRLGEAERRLEVGDLLRLDGSEERRRGILLHAWLREVEWLDDGTPADEVLEGVARRVAPHAPTPWLGERREELRRILAAPAVRRALSRPPRERGEEVELWRERPFAQVVEGRLLHGVLDRVVVVRRRGSAIGADLLELKTDAAAGFGGAGPVDAAVERYRPQLEAYRAALAAMLGVLPTAVRALLVVLLPGVVREL